MSRWLGISAFTRASAAALVVDGIPVAASREELHTREREDARLPIRAARACLRAAGIAPGDLDGAVFFEKPLRRFERELAMQLGAFPRSARTFQQRMSLWLGERLWTKTRLATELGIEAERVLFVPHALAHASAAFLPSPFDEAAVLVVDDAGEWAATSLIRGRGASLEVLDEIHFPHSLVLLAEAVAEHLGLAGPDALDRLVDLAAHGAPGDARTFEPLLAIRSDGSFALDPRPFRFVFDGERAASPDLERILGPARAPGGALDVGGAHAALAASLLARLGDALLALARAARERTGCEHLCLGGRLAGLAPLVGRIAREGPFREIHVAPDPGDGGAALGAALLAEASSGAAASNGAASGGPRRAWRQAHAALGDPPGDVAPAASGREEGPGALDGEARARLAEGLLRGEVVGLAAGRAELAEHPLASRVALADPRSPEACTRLTRDVLHLETWRAPRLAVTAERADELLDLPAALRGTARLGLAEAALREPWAARFAPAVRADGRVQVRVVERSSAPDLAALLAAFESAGGAPALAAWPLARRGEPCARTARDALELLDRTELDLLAIDDRAYARAATTHTSPASSSPRP